MCTYLHFINIYLFIYFIQLISYGMRWGLVPAHAQP